MSEKARKYDASPKGLAAHRRYANSAKGRDRLHRYRHQQRDRLAAIKLAAGCVDCGYAAHHAALDFDHVTGEKRASISRPLADHASWAIIEDEMAKCVVRCSNCHRIKTFENKESGPQAGRSRVSDEHPSLFKAQP